MKKIFGSFFFLSLFGCQVEPCYVPYGTWEVTYTPIESNCLYQDEYKKVIQYDGSIEDLEGLAYNCNGYKKFNENNCSLTLDTDCSIFVTEYPIGRQKIVGIFSKFQNNNFEGILDIESNFFKDKIICITLYKVDAKRIG